MLLSVPKRYFFAERDYKSYSCYACPVLNTCCMCSCWAISTLRVHYDKSGGLQISRHRWAVLAKWIHPWQLMNDVLVVILGLISCTVATLLQCIQWIINWHARPLLKVKQFQRRIILCVIPCDMQLLAVVVSVMWGNCQSSSDGDGPRRWRASSRDFQVMRQMQANLNHHRQEIQLLDCYKYSWNLFWALFSSKKCVHNITLVNPAGEAANANTRIEKYSWKSDKSSC